ncbi:MerR family transcriptional regulator [Pseudonocardia sp. ICBG1293]|uniref:MerR family transcriptional regulator n=2 Tax=Pseudonocardia sp. ICBG1293 TaxID=2844382 RepID=UPI001CCE3B7F|nr:MerR family transcriptional regulator [Pseudonocardia sp. ICBG1293]
MADFPIEELARRAGMTVRTVRTYITRGLLPPAGRAGRAARYTGDHLDRLDLVNGLRRRGFSLGAIEVLVAQDTERTAEDALRLYRGMLAPWQPEEPVEVDEAELPGRLGLTPAAVSAHELLRHLDEAGVVEAAGPGRLRILAPDLARAAAEAVRLGIPPAALVGLRRRLDDHTGAVAEMFVELFARQVWDDYVDAGLPAGDAPRIQQTVEQLQPVATLALLSSFRSRMQDVMDAFITRISDDISPEAGRAMGIRTTDLDDR